MRGLLLLGWLVFVLFLLWPVVRRVFPRREHLADRVRGSQAIRDELVKDPVCLTYILRSRAVTREAGGTTHYFCSRECAARFSQIRGDA